MKSKQPLVVFSDDWGRHPSSCQHLVTHLLDQCDVTWVNTIGTRLPALDGAAIRRSLQKIRAWMQPKAAHGSAINELQVLSPMMWPTFRTPFSRRLNQRLLHRHLVRQVQDLSSSVVLTTVPIVADLVGTVPAARWIYYCVDDFSSWPGLDARTLCNMEYKLIDSVDCIVAAGEQLADRIRKRGRDPVLLTHGIDLAHWSNAVHDAHSLPGLSDIEHPLIMFWGLIDTRLNVEWLAALGQALDRGTIVMVGPKQNADARLAHVPRLRLTGSLSYNELPAAAAAAAVLIMPYADLPVTRAMQPLKLKEYLATGKPVVVSRLPAVTEWEDCLDVATDSAHFTELVLKRVDSTTPIHQLTSRRRISGEGWKTKTELLSRLFS